MTGPVARRVLVSGRVQGVGYRVACARTARQLGLTGQVRNLADQRVEVLVAGDGAVVERLVAWCRTGPPGAAVVDVAVAEWVPPSDLGAQFTVVS